MVGVCTLKSVFKCKEKADFGVSLHSEIWFLGARAVSLIYMHVYHRQLLYTITVVFIIYFRIVCNLVTGDERWWSLSGSCFLFKSH